MARYAVLFVIAIMLIFTNVPGSADDNDYQIVPGERIGNIRLGVNIDQAVESLGAPESVREEGLNYCYQFSGRGIVLQARKTDNGVTSIETTDARYHTEGGLGVGGREDEISSYYDPPDEIIVYGLNRQYIYRNQGVIFQVYDRQIKSIQIRFASW